MKISTYIPNFQIKKARYYTLIVGILTLCLIFPWMITFGASDEFTVGIQIDPDTTPPSVPANLTVTPVTTTQINLTWATSTDDYIVAGYHVWRDGIHIATTTTTTYADTGLTASTTYAYYVTAFDPFFNISASSTVVVATTLSSPGGSTSGTRIRPLSEEIFSLFIFPQKDSATIRYETHGYTRSVIKWGRTTSYELGSLAEQVFSTNHESNIIRLTPETKYYFTIEGENKFGQYGTMYTGTFITLPQDDVFPPGNVTGLTAVREGNDIIISWTNPTDSDLAKVRVMRSDLFFPSDTADGWVTYEGLGTTVRDRGSALTALRQYYTVFTYDELGNISSGAVVSIYLGDGTIPEKEVIDPTKNEIALTFDNIEFSQEGDIVMSENGSVTIDGAKQLTISIPYSRVPEHLKTILVVIGDSTDTRKTFMFILRVNKEKTAYTGTLAPFGISGNFPIQVSVFDFKTAQVGYTNGTIVSSIYSIHQESKSASFAGFLLWFTSTIIHSYVLWFILLLVLLLFVSRHLLRTKW